MDPTTQQRFRPALELLLKQLETLPPPAEPASEAAHRRRLLGVRFALERIDGGYYGRCVRCSYNLPLARLDKEPDAVTCIECRPTRKPRTTHYRR